MLQTLQSLSFRPVAPSVATSIQVMPVVPMVTRVRPSGLTTTPLDPKPLAATPWIRPADWAGAGIWPVRRRFGTPLLASNSVTTPRTPFAAYRREPSALSASDQWNPDSLDA